MSRYGNYDEDDYFEPTRHIKKTVNGCRVDDYRDEDDLYENRIEFEAVTRMLKSNVYHQEGLRANADRLKRWLSESEEFATAWKDFIASGGINADDFKSFMAGTFRCRLVRRKKHLRLVANAKPQRIRLRVQR
jgi:hypothetical protein